MRKLQVFSILILIAAALLVALPASALPLPMQAGVYDNTSPHFIYYGGTWTPSADANWFNSTVSVSSADSAGFAFKLLGGGFVFQYTACSTCADMDIQIYYEGAGACPPGGFCPTDIETFTIFANSGTTVIQQSWQFDLGYQAFMEVEVTKNADFYGGSEAVQNDAVFVYNAPAPAYPTQAPIELTLPPFPTAEPPAWIHQYELDGVPVAYEYSASTGEIAIAMLTGGLLIVSIIGLLMLLWGKR